MTVNPSPNVPEGFRTMIRAEMDKQKLSFRELAKDANISASGLLRIIRGEYLPSNESILDIAKALKIDPPEVLLVEAGRVPRHKGNVNQLFKAISSLNSEELKKVDKVVQAIIAKSKKETNK